MIELRDYQREAIEDLWRRWDAGSTRVPMVLATGLGKSLIFAHAAKRFLDENPGKRVLVLAHTTELIDQAVAHLRRNVSGVSIGVVKAERNETHARIVVSSRQTLVNEKRREQVKNVGLIVGDECHHFTRRNSYGKILDHFGAFDATPRVKVVGFTATLSRGDKQKLSAVWEECTFKRDLLFGIRSGFLLDVRGVRVVVPDLDLSNVKKVAGDYSDESMAEELERTFAPQIVAEKYAEVAGKRRGIAFWPLVSVAYHAAEAFTAAGIPSAVIHGGLPKEERKLTLKRFAAGEITVVHNCMVLTEGFDAPWADVVVVGRPTKSQGLYQQIIGRVLRPDLTIEASARDKALILDVTGAGAGNDLRCLIDLSPERPLRRDAELSLLDLDEEYELLLQTEGAPSWPEEIYAGPAETKPFDPLHRDKLWSQTPGGTFFMSAGGEQYVFLGETRHGDPGLWDVVWMTKSGQVQAGSTQYVALPLEEALLWAEEEAIERGGVGAKTLAQRNSRWRSAMPKEDGKQVAYATRLGVQGAQNMTRGELSEAIDTVVAARRIDPFVRLMKG